MEKTKRLRKEKKRLFRLLKQNTEKSRSKEVVEDADTAAQTIEEQTLVEESRENR